MNIHKRKAKRSEKLNLNSHKKDLSVKSHDIFFSLGVQLIRRKKMKKNDIHFLYINTYGNKF